MQPINAFLRTYHHVIISVAILLFCLYAMVFALFPTAKYAYDSFIDMKALSRENDLLRHKLETLTSFHEETLREQLTDVLSAVPSDRSFPTAFETIEQVAVRNGVSISNISVVGAASLASPSASKMSATEKKIGTRTIPLSVTVNGTLQSLEQFIAMMPQVRRLFRVRSFSISFPKESNSLTVEINMDAFYEPLPTAIGSARETLPSLTADEISTIEQISRMPLMISTYSNIPTPMLGRQKDNPFAP